MGPMIASAWNERRLIAALWLLVCAVATLLAATPAHADVTPADLAGQPAIMKTDCRNRLGQAGKSLCNSDAAYSACLTYLRAGHWDYCIRAGEAGSQAERIAMQPARVKLASQGCAEFAVNYFRCPNIDFNRSQALSNCIAYRNGGSGIVSCLGRDFLEEYADRIEARFRGQPVGYAFVLTNGDGAHVERAGGAARKAPDANPMPMTPASPLPMASVSKTISAAATIRALADRGLTIDAPVWSYLPSDWTIPTAFKALTFRQLLRHRSGLYGPNGVRCDETYKNVGFAAVKGCVEGATSLANANLDCDKKAIASADAIGCYQNLDYALLRVAIPRIDRDTANSTALATTDQAARAAAYAAAYSQYVNVHLFAPAGFHAECKPQLGAYQPLVYKLAAPNGAGTDFGDRTLVCGSEGWVLTAQQLGAVVHAMRTPALGSVFDTMSANLAGFAGMGTMNTPFGPSSRWWHSGYYPASQNPGELNTLVQSFSNGVDVALLVNSDFPAAFGNYGQQLTDAFYETMK